jgi:hypothetical protein
MINIKTCRYCAHLWLDNNINDDEVEMYCSFKNIINEKEDNINVYKMFNQSCNLWQISLEIQKYIQHRDEVRLQEHLMLTEE